MKIRTIHPVARAPPNWVWRQKPIKEIAKRILISG
jgi:hypothetical protein